MAHFKIQSIVSILIAIVFASPIFIDAYLNSPSNLDYLFQASKNMQMDLEKRPTLDDVIFTVPRLIATDGAGHLLAIFYSTLGAILIFFFFFLPKGTLHKKDFFLDDTQKNIYSTLILCFAIYFVCIFYHWKYTSDLNYYSMFYLMALPPIFYTALLTPLFLGVQNNLRNKNISLKFLCVFLGAVILGGGVIYKNIDTNQNLKQFFMSPYRFLTTKPIVPFLKNQIKEEYQKTGRQIVIADIAPALEKTFIFERERDDVSKTISAGIWAMMAAAAQENIPVCIAFTEKSLKENPHLPFFYTPHHICPPGTPADFEFLFAPKEACDTEDIACTAFVKVKKEKKDENPR